MKLPLLVEITGGKTCLCTSMTSVSVGELSAEQGRNINVEIAD